MIKGNAFFKQPETTGFPVPGMVLKSGGAFLFSLLLLTAQAQESRTGGDTLTLTRTTTGNRLTGTVTVAATGARASGVQVEVNGVSATITDAQGGYSLRVPDYRATVAFYGEGFSRKEVALKGRTTLNVALLDDSHESPYDPVMTPFGVKSKSSNTASLGQYRVNGYTQNAEVPDALLQGRIAGLNAVRRSGAPGAGAGLFLRGYNSLYATNRPLIVVDNMIYDDNDYGLSIIANNYTNPLALIDVKDIDNISVLRDASSIYGTKGANGAILITTARAKEQATKIDFTAYSGFNAAPERLPVMKAADYRIYLSEILQSKGLTSNQIAALPYMNDNPSNPVYHSYHFDTDWQKKVLKNSRNSNYFLKVTGGDNIATYGLSMGFMKNEGIIKTTGLSRYNTRFNAEFNFSKKFTGYSNLSFSYNEQILKDQGIAEKTAPLFLSLIKAPFLHDREVNSQGVESPNLSDRDSLGIGNPTAIINNMQAQNKYYRFFGSFGFQYAISKNWNASTLIGITYDKVRENIFVPNKGVAKDTLTNAVANNRLGSQVKRLYSLYNDTRLEFAQTINKKHSVSAKTGMRYQHNEAEQDFAFGFNSATDELVNIQNGLPSLRQVGGGIGAWNWVNLYANAEYAFANKYFVSLNAAMDGSSRFGREAQNGVAINGYRFAVLPSVAAAWLISSEQFMVKSPINLVKLRASYSVAGNDDIGNYNSRQTYSAQNLLGLQGLVRSGIANPALQWETTHKINAGVDVSFWNERMQITADVFSSKTNNLLVYENPGTVSGFNSVLTNSGSLQNKGAELSVTARLIEAREVKWDLGLTVSRYKNKMVRVPEGAFTTNYAGATLRTANGEAANLFYGYTANGVFSTDAEAASAGLRKKNADGSFSNFGAGDVRFQDVNGDKVIDEADRSVIGDPNADFTGGITNRLSWKRFELTALLTFSQGNDVYNMLRYRLESASGVENQLVSVNNRWRGQGQVTNTPKATFGDPMGNSRFSSRWIEDGSYLRLRNISLQYQLPVSGTVINNISVYATANNLFTLTRYKGFDPEFSARPSVFAQGIDTGLDPQFKNITFGVRLSL